MVKLRLTRMGSINKPFYRVVAVDSRARRDGRYIEVIGHYDPKQNPATVVLDEEKAIKWLKVGAEASETVNSLFRKAGILKKWHEIKYPKKDNADGIEKVKKEKPAKKQAEPKKEEKVIETLKVEETVEEEVTIIEETPIVEEAPIVEETIVEETIVEEAIVEETATTETEEAKEESSEEDVKE